MRVLGCLRDRYKLGILIILSQALCFGAWGESPLIIKSYKDLMKASKMHSAEYKKIQTQFEIDSLNAQNLLSMYNWTVSGGLNNQNAETPSTSPFAPAGESSNVTSNLRLEKKTALGVTPFVELSTSDVSRTFPGAGSVEYQTASLETGMRIDLMRVILGKNSFSVLTEKKLRDEMAQLARKNTDRDFSSKLLKGYFQYLKSYKRLSILTTQCDEYKTLHRISSSRFKRKLIREKDYLSIEVLFQTCLLDKRSAANSLNLDRIAVLKLSGLPLNTVLSLSGVDFPKGAMLKAVSLSNNLDYKLAEKSLEAVASQASSLKADLFPEINLDYSLQSQASDDGVGASISEAMGFDLRTHTVGLNLRYEFGGSAAKITAKRLAVEKKSRSLDFEQLKKSLERDEKRVSGSLLYLTDANAQAQKLVTLQKRKSVLFRKDFENGRGGIRDLVEAQINYLSSLERALDLQYRKTVSRIEHYDLLGESLEKFN